MMHRKIRKTKPLNKKYWGNLNFSQEKVAGFDLKTYQQSRVLLIGAGAIGSNVGLASVRKGIGYLSIFDDDDVEFKNLTRQLFFKKHVGKNKAFCLTKILSKQGFFSSNITGYPFRFQEALEKINQKNYNVIICCVDNNPTRSFVSKYCIENRIPLIMSAVSRDGNQMYVAIQEPDQACFGCIMPNAINDNTYPCNLPGIIDIIQVVSGFTVYALDTVLMNRHREWNIKMVCLDSSIPDFSKLIPHNQDCELCGNKKELKNESFR